MIDYCYRRKIYTITNCSLMPYSKCIHHYVREETRLFIVTLRHYIVVRKSFGVNRRREQQYGGLFLGILIPGLHLLPSPPPGACARADSIIVSQIRPSHYAPLLLRHPAFTTVYRISHYPPLRLANSSFPGRVPRVHPWGKETRGTWQDFSQRSSRRNVVIDWIHRGRLWSACKIGILMIYCSFL